MWILRARVNPSWKLIGILSEWKEVKNACVNFTVAAVLLEGGAEPWFGAVHHWAKEKRFMEHKTSWRLPASSPILTGKTNPETSKSVFFFNATEIPHQDFLGWGRDLPLYTMYSIEHEGAWPGDSRLQRIARLEWRSMLTSSILSLCQGFSILSC